MSAVGVLARFEFLPGHDEEVARFFAAGRAIVEGQPATTGWYAVRVGPTSYAAFAVFASASPRSVALSASSMFDCPDAIHTSPTSTS